MTKVGISLRMDIELLRWIDEKVREGVFATRTHAIKYAVRQLMNRERLQKARVKKGL